MQRMRPRLERVVAGTLVSGDITHGTCASQSRARTGWPRKAGPALPLHCIMLSNHRLAPHFGGQVKLASGHHAAAVAVRIGERLAAAKHVPPVPLAAAVLLPPARVSRSARALFVHGGPPCRGAGGANCSR